MPPATTLATPPAHLQRYCVSIAPEHAAEYLAYWEWLLPLRKTLQPVLMTKLGDWFLADADSRLYWLDLLEGKLEPLEATVDDVGTAAFIERFQDELSVDHVELLLDQGRELPEDMCYGWSVHPILGATFHSSNIQFFSLRMCQWIHSQLHEQMQTQTVGTDE